jgi:3-methyl-2-oxobutanoate hydroxymethyltransferase
MYLNPKFVGANFAKMKRDGRKIVSITAYDLFTAKLALAAGVDFILVGDSLGNVVQGHDTTIPVTLDDIVYHTRIVTRTVGGKTPVFADMPFGTFKITAEDTVRNCIKVFKETACHGVKLEGATPDNLEAIEKLIKIGIPVLGHTGFLPQTVHATGGYKYRGKTKDDGEIVSMEAYELSNAGCCAIVLECVKPEVAAEITRRTPAPTIGIGSGGGCSGQILVIHDLLGMFEDAPSFVKPYADFHAQGVAAMARWVADVRDGRYPDRDDRDADATHTRDDRADRDATATRPRLARDEE